MSDESAERDATERVSAFLGMMHGAQATYAWKRSYVAAGFTEDQAIKVLVRLVMESGRQT